MALSCVLQRISSKMTGERERERERERDREIQRQRERDRDRDRDREKERETDRRIYLCLPYLCILSVNPVCYALSIQKMFMPIKLFQEFEFQREKKEGDRGIKERNK